jgi:hypothetical protein
MNPPSKQRGHLLFALIVFLMATALGSSAVSQSGALKTRLDLTRLQHDQRALLHLKQSLLSHATAQGLHTQSHLGNLPCPALLADSAPQTSCNKKPWGFLPTQSQSKVNFLQPGVAAMHAVNPAKQERNWQYAVSQQVIQPNEMGWSRWVNWSAPGITLHVDEPLPHTLEQVVAVIAQGVQPLQEHTYRVTPPYVVIFKHELRNHVQRSEQASIEHTLFSWLESNPTQAQAGQWFQENLAATDQPTTLKPHDSACACRCTKTRCTCQCAQTGQWLSASPCENAPEHCTPKNTGGQYACTSAPDRPCVFKGAAQLQSHWPVSHYEPLPAAHRACRPTSAHTCPLSDQTQACECKFSWPEQVLQRMAAYEIQLQGNQLKVVQGGS